MTSLRVSDHALLRFIERAGGLDIEVLRAELARSLARATTSAALIGTRDFTVRADGLTYVIRNGIVVTILPARAVVYAGRP